MWLLLQTLLLITSGALHGNKPLVEVLQLCLILAIRKSQGSRGTEDFLKTKLVPVTSVLSVGDKVAKEKSLSLMLQLFFGKADVSPLQQHVQLSKVSNSYKEKNQKWVCQERRKYQNTQGTDSMA